MTKKKSCRLQVAELVKDLNRGVRHSLLLEGVENFGCLLNEVPSVLKQPAKLQRDPSLLLRLHWVVLGVEADYMDGAKVFGRVACLQILNDSVEDALLEGDYDIVPLNVL